MIDRRTVVAGGIALGLLAEVGMAANVRGEAMYGLIGKMKSAPQKRADLLAILTAATGEMPGNLAYIVAEDIADPDGIWITEVWTDKAAHAASLKLPLVQDAIAKARPLIAGFEEQHELRPVAGVRSTAA